MLVKINGTAGCAEIDTSAPRFTLSDAPAHIANDPADELGNADPADGPAAKGTDVAAVDVGLETADVGLETADVELEIGPSTGPDDPGLDIADPTWTACVAHPPTLKAMADTATRCNGLVIRIATS